VSGEADEVAGQGLAARVDYGTVRRRSADNCRQYGDGTVLEATNAALDARSIVVDIGAGAILRGGFQPKYGPHVGRTACRNSFDLQVLLRCQFVCQSEECVRG